MYTKHRFSTSLMIFLALIALLMLSACAPLAPAASATLPPATPAEQAAPTLQVEPVADPTQVAPTEEVASTDTAPAAVALQFYSAYQAAAEKMQPTLGSPSFEVQKLLSDEYLRQLGEIRAGFDGYGFDPVLNAQAVPPEPVEVKETVVDGSQATVVIQFGRGRMETPFERIVSLEQIDGQWQIVPDRVESSPATPAGAVEGFYAWYLGYVGAGSEPRNPLVDGAYRAAPYLDPSLVAKIDQMLAEGKQLPADPFLCAQDVPAQVKAIASYENGSRPVVLAESSFPGHYITLDLARPGFNQWAIRGIGCGGSPASVAKAFYTWALGYMTGSGELRNPWVDGAYRSSPFLSQGFIQKLDELLASGEPLVADPVLLAQDVPSAFTSAACPEENCALVNMQFGEATLRQLRLELVSEGGSLRIDSIRHSESPQPAEKEGWLPLVDEPYGYAVSYPAGWIVSGLKVSEGHTPEEYPQMRSLYFKPAADTEIPPFSLEVVVWPKSDLAELYSLSEKIAEKSINGYPAQVYRSDPGILYTVFQHPARPGVWLVLTDPLTQFPGREEQAREVEGRYETFVATIAFQ